MSSKLQRLDFVECVKDSPHFRSDLEESELDLDNLESKLERVIKLCNVMIETGKAYGTANTNFVTSITELLNFCNGDQMMSGTLRKSAAFLLEVQKFHTILLDQAKRSICTNLRQFIASDVKKVKATQRDFYKFSDELETSLSRHAQVPRTKPTECEETQNMMLASKSRFVHTALDYSYQLNVLEYKKRHDIQQTLLSYVTAQKTFYHQGNDLCHDLEGYFKDLAGKLSSLDKETVTVVKQMENRHSLVQESSQDTGSTQNDSPENHCGYLFKKTSKGFKTWNRRWFFLKNNQLLYTKRLREGFTVMEEDMRLCNVKPLMDGERRFCFEIKSPTRSHLLQASSEEECKLWVEAIQAAILAAYRDRCKSEVEEGSNPLGNGEEVGDESGDCTGSADALTSSAAGSQQPQTTDTAINSQSSVKSSKSRSNLSLILSFPGNSRCCDCGSEDPRWASTNLGITLCIECSGIHRSLGVHISKVRSLTLDSWEPEVLKVMAGLGNTSVNLVYAADVPKAVEQASPSCSRAVREQWINAKYGARTYMKPLLPPSPATSAPTRTATPPSENSAEDNLRTAAEGSPPITDGSLSPSSTNSKVQKTPYKWSVAKRVRRKGDHSAKEESHSLTEGENMTDSNVVLFGTSVNESSASQNPLSLSDSEDSSLEGEDSESHTSLEELGRLTAERLLYRGAEARNIPVMMQALAQRADINWANPEDCQKTPLIKAVESGSIAASEFLLLNRAKVDLVDAQGRSALHHATRRGHTGQVCQLVKRGANHRLVDSEGVDALSLAIRAEHADIVTLLRVGQLREEMTDADPGVVTDELFNDVFRDYTNIASTEPDKLKRSMATVE